MSKRNRVKAKLRLYPDPILKAVCEPVGDDEDVSGVIRDMMHILTNSKTGVGLAAPQAGHTKRVIVVKTNDGYQPMINPEIDAAAGFIVHAKEGCLSYPGKFKNIPRRDEVAVTWTSEVGATFVCKVYRGTVARIILHEIDHLDSKCKVGE